MRRSLTLLALLLACNRPKPSLEVLVEGEAAGAGELDFTGTPYGGLRTLEVRLASSYPKPLRLEVRLEDPVPTGMTARLDPPVELLPRGSGRTVLVLRSPSVVGAIAGAFTIYCPDEASASATFRYRGDVVKQVQSGPFVHFDPSSVNVGKVRPGDERPFVFAVRAVGTEAIEILDAAPEDPRRLALRESPAGARIVPGGELQVNGLVRAPDTAGAFVERIRIATNSTNQPRVDVRVSGEVMPRYEPIPQALADQPVRSLRPEAAVRLKAGPGEAPFTVASATGGEGWFELVSRGSETPAEEQEVRFRLRADAPVGRSAFRIVLRVAPAGVDVVWPVELDVRPNIVAIPPRLLPQARRGTTVTLRVDLHSYAQKPFRVLEVRPPPFLRVELKEHPPLPPYLSVSSTAGQPKGVYDDPPIELLTDDPDTPRILIPVRLEIVD